MSALTKELSRSLPPKGDRQDKARGPTRQGGSIRAQEQAGKSPGTTVLRDERLLFTFQALIGHPVQVKVKSGAIYEGVFHTANPEGKDSDIVLKYARLAGDEFSPSTDSAQPVIKTFKVLWSDFVSIAAKDLKLSAKDLAPTGSAADGFSTDAEIGRRRGGLDGRELQRWVPDESDAADGLDLTSAPQQSGKWNQFAVNQKKFGVVTSFNENLYTTRLDKSRSKISEAEADRLATEIEGQVSGNAHLAEERGMETDDHGDEEARYSSVVRPGQQAARPGSASSRPLENGAGSAKGVDIPSVATRGQQGDREAGGTPRNSSQPIDVDPRREHNKVRMQLTGAKVTSPYGTPKSLSRSPLTSPLVGNAVQVQALDLNPGSAKFDPDTRKEFQAFKLQQQRGPAEAAQTARGFTAPSSGGTAASSPDGSGDASRQQREAAAKPASNHAADSAPGPSEAAASTSTAAGLQDPAAQPSSSSSKTEKPTSKLNPFAKSFSFNPAASTFVPGAASRPSTAAPALANGAAARPTAGPSGPTGPPSGPSGASPGPSGGPTGPTGSSRPSTSAGPGQNRVHRANSAASGNSDSTSGPHRELRSSQRNSNNNSSSNYLNRASSQSGPMSPPRADAKGGTAASHGHMGQQQGQRTGRYMPPQQQQQPQPPQYMPSARPFLVAGPSSPQQTAMFVQRGQSALGTMQLPNSAQFLMQPGGIPAFPIIYNAAGMGLQPVSGQMPGPMFAASQYSLPPMGMSQQMMSQQMMNQHMGSEEFGPRGSHQPSSHGSR